MPITEKRNLESSNFNIYPHYVFATAFLVNGELADYKYKIEKEIGAIEHLGEAIKKMKSGNMDLLPKTGL